MKHKEYDENITVFEGIKTGLEQAVAHAKGENDNVRKFRIKIEEIPDFTAKEIKRIRNAVHLSQSLFARVLGVSVKTVEKWESGENHPMGPASRIIGFIAKDQDFLSKYGVIREE